MDPGAAIRVWRVATTAERQEIDSLLATKIEHSETLTDARKEDLMAEMQRGR